MKITHIECSNIKSFKSLSADLIDFNVIIGMNGSGKSNFILIFKMIKDILSDSLANAVANQGGAELLKNFFMPKNQDTIRLKYNLQLASEMVATKQIGAKDISIRIKSICSETEFSVGQNNDLFYVLNDKLEVAFEYFSANIKIGSSSLIALRRGEQYTFDLLNYDAVDYELHEVFPNIDNFATSKYPKSEIILHQLFKMMFGIDIKKSPVTQISVYEFEQDLLSTIKANNVSIEEKETREMFLDLLQCVLTDEGKKKTFFNLLNFVLPDIDDVVMERDSKNEQRFLVKERFNSRYIPAYLLSDGTVFLIVIILALYFDNKYLTIFDEPERRIHPHIISKVIDMMKDVSRNKQIILSTHNSEIVKYSGIESIILIKRDDEGYSLLSHPQNSREISIFLDNEIGLDELFVQNMLL